jgi:hypothetical protein
MGRFAGIRTGDEYRGLVSLLGARPSDGLFGPGCKGSDLAHVANLCPVHDADGRMREEIQGRDLRYITWAAPNPSLTQCRAR